MVFIHHFHVLLYVFSVGIISTARSQSSNLVDRTVPDELVDLSIQDFIDAARTPEEAYTEQDIVPAYDPTANDIIESEHSMEQNVHYRHTRAAVKSGRWPNATIPYQISSQFTRQARILIARAINQFHTHTCIRFVQKKPEDSSYLNILSNGRACGSMVGRQGSAQNIHLDPEANCLREGIIMHELMHAVGFHHEQNRADRDDWVRIIYDNMLPPNENINCKNNFIKRSLDEITQLGIAYDYESLMHYARNICSKHYSLNTIEAKRPGAQKMGQRLGFSSKDIEKLNKFYNCYSDK